MAKTISFVKGKGSIAHNNREFVAANVDRERTELNVIYVSQPIREAYDECFGEAVREYNEKQTRNDRKKDDYMSDIKNSGNGEKLFYENVIQIGKMSDKWMVAISKPLLNRLIITNIIPHQGQGFMP